MSKRKEFGYGGFSLPEKEKYNMVAPPPPKKQMYMPSPGRSDDEDENAGPAYASDDDKGKAPNAPSDNHAEEEEDPLDAFMAGIETEVKKAPKKKEANKPLPNDQEEEDPMESYMAARAAAGLPVGQGPLFTGDGDSDEEVYATARAVDAANAAKEAGTQQYDSDDNLVVPAAGKKEIEALPPLDHSSVSYGEIFKDLYEESLDVIAMTPEEVTAICRENAIRVSGFDVPRPVTQWEHLGLDEPLMACVRKQNYARPTGIQCQVLPIALSGRDCIGIAKTGSGKTVAFVLPMVAHIMAQEELEKGEGPIAIVCAPTRELAQQIYAETRKFAKAYNLRVAGVFGGMSKFEQFKELKAGVEVIVATPGRLIDMMKMKAFSTLRASYLVLDEADRMFDMGFEPQVRSIVGQIRPDRQTMLFSATMPGRVERLAREALTSPVRVTVGEVGVANSDIRQLVEVLPGDEAKLPWLLARLQAMVDDGDVLVFSSTKSRTEELEKALALRGVKVGSLHGDKDQASRMEILKAFKEGSYHVLVATDVAARGLDIKSIKTVVNYDIARDIDSHVHRIGRTGRAGAKDGTAYTLVTQREARFAGELVDNLQSALQPVPDALVQLAMRRDERPARARPPSAPSRTTSSGRFRASSWRPRGEANLHHPINRPMLIRTNTNKHSSASSSSISSISNSSGRSRHRISYIRSRAGCRSLHRRSSGGSSSGSNSSSKEGEGQSRLAGVVACLVLPAVENCTPLTSHMLQLSRQLSPLCGTLMDATLTHLQWLAGCSDGIRITTSKRIN
eukprot:jgi/Mesvir1/19274/Mv10354-RA.1